MKSDIVVLYPSPGIGHLVSMVELGKLIHTHHPALSVIIFITPAPFETGSTDKYIKTVSSTNPSITFHQLPIADPPRDFSSEFIDLAFGIPEFNNPIVHEALVRFSEKSAIKAVVLDFFSNAAFQISTSLNIPTYYSVPSYISQPSTRSLPRALKMLMFSLTFLECHLYILHICPRFGLIGKPTRTKKFIDTANNMAKSSGIIANTFFVGLEERAVAALRDGKCVPDGPTPPTYFIGPLIAVGTHVDPSENEWLNAQPSKSVVFLCFGSQGVLKKEQSKEIAIGLETSEQRFLWVVRSSGGKELSLDAILPQGFFARTADKGLVVTNWAPQPAILGHESVGGFVSHCGWNSALEAVVAWPLYAEQKMNRVYLVEEIKVALAVNMSTDDFVTAESLEKTVRELMHGEEGAAVRERILEIRGRAKAAVEDGGSSKVEFFNLIQSWTAV